MVKSSLQELRAQIERLAVDIGQYTIICARTGDHPVPIAGLEFPDRESAIQAARFAQYYRARLRRYDSRVAYHDLIVCEARAYTQGWTDTSESRFDWYHRFAAVADRELKQFRDS